MLEPNEDFMLEIDDTLRLLYNIMPEYFDFYEFYLMEAYKYNYETLATKIREHILEHYYVPSGNFDREFIRKLMKVAYDITVENDE